MASSAGMAYNKRILDVLWYGSLGGPLVIATAFLAFDLEIGVGWLPSKLLWNATLVLLALLLVASRPLVRHLLTPERVAARPVPAAMAAPDDVAAQALAKVQVTSMLAAALLNALPMVLTLLGVLHAEEELALVTGVLALATAALAKPDFVNLLLAVEGRLKRRKTG
jgi:hypothetical protein